MCRVVIGLLTLVFTVAITAAGDDPPAKPDPVPRLKKKARPPAAQEEPKQKEHKTLPEDEPKKELKPLGEGDPRKADAAQAQAQAEERTKELLTRIGKNMQSSEDRLGKQDPGEGTRQIQGDILKDIDELLKQ